MFEADLYFPPPKFEWLPQERWYRAYEGGTPASYDSIGCSIFSGGVNSTFRAVFPTGQEEGDPSHAAKQIARNATGERNVTIFPPPEQDMIHIYTEHRWSDKWQRKQEAKDTALGQACSDGMGVNGEVSTNT
ncbi:hypothetical protein C7212DRAFT_344388 [Tuber magnatum]|uniref:Uncharacterized protein n=1 Tax=Tuber magnatum TaxID=42249 RepID=A0A317SMI5_9PEZI|nr:hypothetical protein C7212DRAFT_344388 [Tuber magnatum]